MEAWQFLAHPALHFSCCLVGESHRQDVFRLKPGNVFQKIDYSLSNDARFPASRPRDDQQWSIAMLNSLPLLRIEIVHGES